MKDLFSQNSQLYKQARPDYPHSVIHEILKHTPEHSFAWDCGAGSGQFTQLLVPYFEQIVATDLSESQLQSALILKMSVIKFKLLNRQYSPIKVLILLSLLKRFIGSILKNFMQKLGAH